MELADINRREVLRYLGYKNQEADENVSRIVEDCLELLWKNVSPKYRVREFPLTLGADNRIDGEVFQTKSRNLSVNLKDCEKILVFAATLGVGADYLIQKYNRLEMSRAVILQAASAAMIEEYCDQVCEGLKKEYKSEVANVCSLIFDVYKDFNITDYRCVLSLRDPADKKKYHDDDAMWNHAENALREVLTELGINFTEEIGEAAFYGPKLDVNVKPAVGAEYTLSTCQLDFCLPAKFHLTYIDKDGSEKTPVVLHRAILGSLDRFMAYLIEETKGRFPTWLAPTQVKVLPVSEKTLDYARTVADKLTAAGVRVVLDESNEKIGYKIREAQQVDRVPYMLVLGAKEAEAGNISVRDRKGETTTQELDAFINNIVTEIKERRYN